MGIENTLEYLKNALNNLRWNQQHSAALLGSSLHQEIKQNNTPFSRKLHNMRMQKQQRDLNKENEVGNFLYALGMDLKTGRSENCFLTFKKLESCLSKVDWSLNWALEAVMLALVQARFLEHLGERVKFIIASCFSDILEIVSPFPPCNVDIMKRVFQLIME